MMGACAALTAPAFAQTPDPGPARPAATDSALRPEDVTLLRQALADADAHGLETKDLIPAGLDDLLNAKEPEKRKRGEALLKSAALRYARQVHSGRLAVAEFDDEWGLRPAAFDPKPGLENALAQNGVAAWLASLPPRHGGYQAALKQLAVYRDIAAKGGWAKMATGPKLKPGDADKRAAALRARLVLEDSSAPATGPDMLDGPLVEALKAFQRRHGLLDDGELGAGTLAALNTPVERRVAQIQANMERWRWLPETLPQDRVDVNIAGAMTTLVRGGEVVLVMKAAPGRKTDHTPMLQSAIDGVVLNPRGTFRSRSPRRRSCPRRAPTQVTSRRRKSRS